jgi:hypothetical protein
MQGRAGGSGDAFALLPAAVVDLDAYRWKNRPVLLFAPSPDDPAYVEQRALFHAAAEGLLEREIVVLIDTEPKEDGELRRRFDVQGFEVLLVGKDGGVKLRKQKPIASEELRSEMDLMPMRRREISDQMPFSQLLGSTRTYLLGRHVLRQSFSQRVQERLPLPLPLQRKPLTGSCRPASAPDRRGSCDTGDPGPRE